MADSIVAQQGTDAPAPDIFDQWAAESAAERRDELDQLWDDFLECTPLAESGKQVMALEEQVKDDGAFRRMLLCTMKFGGKELLGKAKSEDGAYAAALAIKAGQYWIGRTKELVALMETQIVRLELSLMETEDMEALLEKAGAELFE